MTLDKERGRPAARFPNTTNAQGISTLTRDRTDQHKTGGRLDGIVSKPKSKPLSADLQAHIGVRLKAYYDSVLSEPIPDRFAQLLDQLDTAEPDGASARPRDGASSAEAGESATEQSVFSGSNGGTPR